MEWRIITLNKKLKLFFSQKKRKQQDEEAVTRERESDDK